MVIKECKKHGRTKHFRRKETKSSFRCYQCSLDAQTKRRHKLKAELIAMHGGSCQICGYDKHQGSLQFHHLNSSKKDFRLSKLGSYSRKRAIQEAKKCALLCSNCHQEVHDGVATIE